MSKQTRSGEMSHAWLHVFLIFFTIIAVYPVLWVITVAFSGQQSLAFADARLANCESPACSALEAACSNMAMASLYFSGPRRTPFS